MLAGAAAQPRRLAVLALLARGGRAGVTREKVLNLLWPDEPEERARRSLNQAVYSLRRDLGSDDVLLGSKDVRLNLDLIEVDVIEFADAVHAGDVARAVQLYTGPFLDGFVVPRAAELDQWIESERASLALDYAGALERVATLATARGDGPAAVAHWRKLAATDPLNGRIAVAVMNALVAVGDVSGAMQHARLHEALLDQELGLPPDRDVAAFARRLREQSVAVADTPRPIEFTAGQSFIAIDPVPPSGSPPPSADSKSESDLIREELVGAAETEAETTSAVSRPGRRRWWIATAVATIVVSVAIGGAMIRARDGGPIFARRQVIAVGTITDYAAADSSGIARALRDMLATNLARSPDLSVVSGSRLLEVEREMTGGKPSTPGEIVPVARQAGATTLVDGTLYSVAGDTLRFDLRVTRLRDGSLLRAYTVTGRDPFALADSATTHLVRYLGSTAPAGSVADGTTHSVNAYRLYEEGLRSYYLGDATSSEPLFAAALAEDSTFAMAAYYYALASRGNRVENVKRLRRAVSLASRANERDRLIIQGGWALTNSLRSLRAIAETLVTRYPTEVDGHYLLGIAVVNAGTYLQAIPSLRRVQAMDSLSLFGRSARCAACDALALEVSAYMAADSQAAAERAARRWLAARPNEWRPWAVLGGVLAAAGRGEEARAAIRKSDSLDFRAEAWEAMATLLMREGRFTEADEILRKEIAKGGPDAPSAHWFLAISLRYQGRPAEALGNARAYRRAAAAIEHTVPGAVDGSGMGEAQVLRELGRYREAAALFDSVSRFNVPGSDPSAEASARIWGLTHEAGALATGGDTSRLATLADSIGAFGAVTNLVRDSQLHHHVRGLLLAARGADADAVKEFRQAITSPPLGYTRSNVEMARSLLRLGRYREAVRILEPALRGGIQSGNFYTTYPEIRLLLAQAYAGSGQRDRANRELDWVRRAWVNADANVRPQLDSVARIVAKH